MNKARDILIIRNDKLGDFMLAWPALSLMKKQYPEAHISVLVPSYTKPIADICPWVDHVIPDNLHISTITDAKHLAGLIKLYQFDASISLYSEMRTALATRIARIPNRYGPATKLAQVFLNKRLRQKRSLSEKPEFEYNVDLVRHYIESNGDKPATLQKPPFLAFDQKEVTASRTSYTQSNNINADNKLIIIHAGTGGSAINLSLPQFSKLASRIEQAGRFHFVLTAGPGELDTANALSALMKNSDHSVYHSTEGLVNFAKFIAICDLFISGSTGPLHIAGALNIPTAAFYPARQSATPLRWQTLNAESRRVAFSPEKFTGVNDMQTIDMESCAVRIIELLER